MGRKTVSRLDTDEETEQARVLHAVASASRVPLLLKGFRGCSYV